MFVCSVKLQERSGERALSASFLSDNNEEQLIEIASQSTPESRLTDLVAGAHAGSGNGSPEMENSSVENASRANSQSRSPPPEKLSPDVEISSDRWRKRWSSVAVSPSSRSDTAREYFRNKRPKMVPGPPASHGFPKTRVPVNSWVSREEVLPQGTKDLRESRNVENMCQSGDVTGPEDITLCRSPQYSKELTESGTSSPEGGTTPPLDSQHLPESTSSHGRLSFLPSGALPTAAPTLQHFREAAMFYSQLAAVHQLQQSGRRMFRDRAEDQLVMTSFPDRRGGANFPLRHSD